MLPSFLPAHPAARLQGPGPFACQYEGCHQRFKKKQSLTAHSRLHRGDKPFLCPEGGCRARFVYASSLYSHLRSHRGEKPWLCPRPGCGKRFAQPASLRAHDSIHTGERRHPCPLEGCPKWFRRKGDSLEHLQRHCFPGAFLCPVETCSKTFNAKRNLRAHLAVHSKKRPHACDATSCQKRFLRRTDLTRHQSACHSQGAKNAKDAKDPVCPQEGDTTRSRTRLSLLRHLQAHANNSRCANPLAACDASFPHSARTGAPLPGNDQILYPDTPYPQLSDEVLQWLAQRTLPAADREDSLFPAHLPFEHWMEPPSSPASTGLLPADNHRKTSPDR